MATADPGSFPFQGAIAVTAYPSTPQIAGAQFGAGRWTIANPDAAISLYVSENGVDDYVIIPPGALWTSESSSMGSRLWIKLSSAGSVTVTAQITNRAKVGLGT